MSVQGYAAVHPVPRPWATNSVGIGFGRTEDDLGAEAAATVWGRDSQDFCLENEFARADMIVGWHTVR